MKLEDDPPPGRDTPTPFRISGRSFAFACGLPADELLALAAQLRARGGRIDPDLSSDTDVLVVGSLPGLGRLAEDGREVILRGELYRDRLGLLEFVTEAALRASLTSNEGGDE